MAQQRGAALLEKVLAHDSTATLWRTYRDRAVLLEAAIIGRAGQHVQALGLDQDVLHRIETDRAADSDTDRFWLLERCRLQIGDDLSSLSRADEARKEWEAIAQSLSGPITTYEPKLLVVLQAADIRLARPAAAEFVAKHLRDMSTLPDAGNQQL